MFFFDLSHFLPNRKLVHKSKLMRDDIPGTEKRIKGVKNDVVVYFSTKIKYVPAKTEVAARIGKDALPPIYGLPILDTFFTY